ncbi:hypothetical protein ABNC92_18815 [Paenibacillus larvae]
MMILLSIAILTMGIFLLGISGLEKIIIFHSFHQPVPDIETIKKIIPSEIWDIPIYTFITGVFLIVLGLFLLVYARNKKTI